MNTDMDIFSTRDLHFAAFLKMKGVPLQNLERHTTEYKDRNPVYFIFSGRELCEKLEEVFWTGIGEGAEVNVKDYVATIRDLRARTSSVNRIVNKQA